jgi:hypothetical protein
LANGLVAERRAKYAGREIHGVCSGNVDLRLWWKKMQTKCTKRAKDHVREFFWDRKRGSLRVFCLEEI